MLAENGHVVAENGLQARRGDVSTYTPAVKNELVVQEVPTGVRFAVVVAPRASREAVLGAFDGALKVALTAPPVEGAANEALIAFVARTLGVAKREVRITAGQSSRRKRLEVSGVSAQAVRALV